MRTAALWRPGARKATRHFGNIFVRFVEAAERPLKMGVYLVPGAEAAGLALSFEKRYEGADAVDRSAWPLAPHAGASLIWRWVHRGGIVVMVKNVGAVDRVARVCAGCFLIFLAWAPSVILSADPSVDYWLKILLYVGGGYFLITAALGTCLIYRVLDVDSHVHGGTYHSGEDVFDGRGGE